MEAELCHIQLHTPWAKAVMSVACVDTGHTSRALQAPHPGHSLLHAPDVSSVCKHLPHLASSLSVGLSHRKKLADEETKGAAWLL